MRFADLHYFTIRSACRCGLATIVLLLTAATFASDHATLRVGATETIITPDPVGTYLVGPSAKSTGVHDDLYARVLVIADGRQRVAIVTSDLLVVTPELDLRIREGIEKATGIPKDRVVFNTSHTHSAPIPGLVGPNERKMHTPYMDRLVKLVAKATEDAVEQLRPAKLRVGRSATQIGFNRRLLTDTHVTMAPNPHGAVVPWTDVLGAYEAENGKRIAVLFTFAAHPVIIHGTSTLISAEFPGFAIAHLRRGLARDGKLDGMFMFAQGCGADINAFPLQGGIDAAKAAGVELARAVHRVKFEDVPSSFLRTGMETVKLPFQDPPSVHECKKLVAKHLNDVRYRELLAKAESGEPQFMDYPIWAYAVGETFCIASLSHEPFAEYQLNGVKDSPFRHTIVLGYNGGVDSYIATNSAYQLGQAAGYEAAPHMHAIDSKHRLALKPESQQLIHKGLMRVLERLKSADGP